MNASNAPVSLIASEPWNLYIVIIAVLILYICGLLALFLRKDTNPQRLYRLVLDGAIVKESCIVLATSWVHRRIGLLNHSQLPPKSGLYLAGSRKVHTMGMLFPIDIIFLDKHGEITNIYANVPPGHPKIEGIRATKNVLEIAGGAAAVLGLTKGKKVTLNQSDQPTVEPPPLF